MGGCACCNRGGPNDYLSKEIKCLDLPEGDDVVEEHAKKVGAGQQENDDVIFSHVASTLRSSKEEKNVQVE